MQTCSAALFHPEIADVTASQQKRNQQVKEERKKNVRWGKKGTVERALLLQKKVKGVDLTLYTTIIIYPVLLCKKKKNRSVVVVSGQRIMLISWPAVAR